MMAKNTTYAATWGTPIGQDCIDLKTSMARWLGERLSFLAKYSSTFSLDYDTKDDWDKAVGDAACALLLFADGEGFYGKGYEDRAVAASDAMQWVAKYYHDLWD